MRIIRAHMRLVGIEHNLIRSRRFTYAPTVGQKGVHQYALDVVLIGKFSFVEDKRLESLTGSGMNSIAGHEKRRARSVG
jgi:hypothetical protein